MENAKQVSQVTEVSILGYLVGILLILLINLSPNGYFRLYKSKKITNSSIVFQSKQTIT